MVSQDSASNFACLRESEGGGDARAPPTLALDSINFPSGESQLGALERSGDQESLGKPPRSFHLALLAVDMLRYLRTEAARVT